MDGLDFVGREVQLADLNQVLATALDGRGRICFVTGQAGSGKTALVNQFLERAIARSADLIVATGAGNSQTGIGDPYLPFREVIGMLTGDVAANQAAEKISAERAHRLRTVMVRSIQVLVEVAPELVGVLVPGAKLVTLVGKVMAQKAGWTEHLDKLARRENLLTKSSDPAADQGRIVEQFTSFIQQLSVEAPLILFIDDLQWADSASLNLLFHLSRHIENHPILLLGAYRANDLVLGRDGHRHPLEAVVHELTRYYGDICIDLDEIPEPASRAFVDQLLDAEPNCLARDFREALFHQTSGHALFTVELIRAMRERGNLTRNVRGEWVAAPTLDWSALPAKVEGVIAERLGRLDEDLMDILTVGSVEGEEFIAEVVARVETLVEREAIRMLSNELQRRHGLVDARGLVRLGGLQMSLYRFAHNLFQQYIYNNLNEAEKSYLHRDVGAVLEMLFGERTEDVAERLARHFGLAGLPHKAAYYRLQAGNKARRVSAHSEAIGHFQEGLRMAAAMPASPARDEMELGLQTALGTTCLVTHGYASFEVQQAFARAQEISRTLDEPQKVIPVVFGLTVYFLVRGDFDQTLEEAGKLLATAEKVGDQGYQLGAHLILGASYMYLGNLAAARGHLEQAVVQYEPSVHFELAYSQGQDPAVSSLAFLALVLWIQGYPDQAIAAKDAALALAQKINHPYSLAYCSSIATTLFCMLRQDDACTAQAEITLALSKGRFPLWQAASTVGKGWAMAVQGDVVGGIQTMADAVAMWENTGAVATARYFRSRLAEVYLLAGRRQDGLRTLDEGSHGTEVWWLSDEYRVRAELLLLEPGHEPEAEAYLRQAVSLTQEQKARSLELRASMSLARLLHRQGKTAEGRDLLVNCYSSFTEGLETPDLLAARGLLAELNRSIGRPEIFAKFFHNGDAGAGESDAGDALGDAVSDGDADDVGTRVL